VDVGADPVVGQPAASECLRRRICVPAERGGGRQQLERRARWIQAIAGPVQQRLEVGILLGVVARAHRRPRIADAREQIAGRRVDHDGRRMTARRAARVRRDDRRDTRLQPRIDRQPQFAVRIHRGFHRRMIGFVSMAQQRHQVGVLAPQHHRLRPVPSDDRHQRLVVVESPEL
jgi:hypothetical protein